MLHLKYFYQENSARIPFISLHHVTIKFKNDTEVIVFKSCISNLEDDEKICGTMSSSLEIRSDRVCISEMCK